jgi:hypothetical protein
VIETLWARLGEQVKRRGPFTEDDLKAFVEDAWRSVRQTEVRRLCDEFFDRCRVCVQQRGGRVTRTLLLRFRKKAGAVAA